MPLTLIKSVWMWTFKNNEKNDLKILKSLAQSLKVEIFLVNFIVFKLTTSYQNFKN